MARDGKSAEVIESGLWHRAPFIHSGWLSRVTRANESDLQNPGASELELEVATLRALLRAAFSHAPIGMTIVDAADRVVIANDALCQIIGYSAEELAMRAIADLVMPEDRAVGADARERLVAGKMSCHDVSVRLKRADGSPVWAALTVAVADTEAPGTLIYQVQDISERRELEGRLRYLVDHDMLTGLFNRHRFDQELARQVQRHRRFGGGGAVLMIDLDGFKGVNDHFGHAVGDELLCGLGRSLRERSRETDVTARLSGDEFAILLPEADRKAAEVVAADIIGLVRQQTSVTNSQQARVTASVGVALLDDLTDGEVLARSDAAMYAAKESGRDRFVFYEPSEPYRHSRQAGEASRLRRALSEQRFVMYCQPLWNLAERRVEKHELLIRMRNETSNELVAPNAFLYAAERFGLITAIDSWVVSQAVSLIAEQARHGRRIVLSVNLSGRSIGDPALDRHIDRVLQDSAIDPSCLIFELTETAAIGNIDAAVAFSQRLHRRGCQFALDDFGAGFASFYYLKKLPFDFIKIDGDFIRKLTRSPVDQLVVSAIVTIARGMGKQTIAEFVTDQETSDLLRDSGVDYAQGYYIGRPAPARDVLAPTT